jgi:nitroreductase
MFDRVLREAVPVPEQLQEFLLANLTTAPHSHNRSLGLIWMQCQPYKWVGHSPGTCVNVAEMMINQQEQ